MAGSIQRRASSASVKCLFTVCQLRKVYLKCTHLNPYPFLPKIACLRQWLLIRASDHNLEYLPHVTSDRNIKGHHQYNVDLYQHAAITIISRQVCHFLSKIASASAEGFNWALNKKSSKSSAVSLNIARATACLQCRYRYSRCS